MFKKFLNDDRIEDGINVLIENYFSRTNDSTKSMISTLINNEKNVIPNKNSNGNLVSNCPYDLFKLINEGFDLTFQVCKQKVVIIKLANYGKIIVNFFQNTLEELLV